jgi:uncharacterized protein involved in exopolysaccharide biosynthesis
VGPRAQPSESDQDIPLIEVFKAFWRYRLGIALLILLCAVGGAVAAHFAPRKFEAIAVIAPVSESSAGQMGGLSSLISQFGGVASRVGLSVGGDTKKSESLAILQSEALTKTFIQQQNLLPQLYPKLWNQQSKTWKVTGKQIPTLWRGNESFKHIRKVATDTKTGLVTVSITWNDPRLAAEWTNGIIRLANESLKQQAIGQSERNISYLTTEASKTSVVEAKQVIYGVLQGELGKAMLARGSDEYAFKILDPATAPEVRSSPNTVRWIGVAAFVGFTICAAVVLAKVALER